MSERISMLRSHLVKRGIGQSVRDRILRLNPNPEEGCILRGWHPAPTLSNIMFYRDVVGKRAFLQKFGRAAWDALPRASIYRNGKRAYAHRTAVQDRAWLIPADHPYRNQVN